MTEILFRGKRKDNGEWIYGYYCKYGFTGQQKHYIIPDCASALYSYEIIPETVGQFTGLRDKKRKMIFEGDICRVTRHCILCDGSITFKKGSFWFDDFYIESVLELSKLEINNFEIKVIGNIYDNPELMKEGVSGNE